MEIRKNLAKRNLNATSATRGTHKNRLPSSSKQEDELLS
jgi:hypothetical protein